MLAGVLGQTAASQQAQTQQQNNFFSQFHQQLASMATPAPTPSAQAPTPSALDTAAAVTAQTIQATQKQPQSFWQQGSQ
jgi:hypothetical protein